MKRIGIISCLLYTSNALGEERYGQFAVKVEHSFFFQRAHYLHALACHVAKRESLGRKPPAWTVWAKDMDWKICGQFSQERKHIPRERKQSHRQSRRRSICWSMRFWKKRLWLPRHITMSFRHRSKRLYAFGSPDCKYIWFKIPIYSHKPL